MANLKNLLVLGSARFLNTIKGTIEKAEKLGTPRTIQTNLGSTSAASFDGSANVTPGVTGTLPVANGGTGKTNLNDAGNAILNALGTGSATPTDADYYISQYVAGGTTTTTYHRRPMSALWAYINSKMSSAGYTSTRVKGDAESSYRTGDVNITKANIGLGNVENKSSATIRGELTKSNVTTALGFTPYTQSEVDALVSSVFHYKGTKDTYAEVQALTGMKTGDVWQVTADNSEYVYNGSAWEKLGPTIDLSGYLTSVSVAGHTLTPGSNSVTAAQLKTALGLKALAYKDSASGSYEPEGTVSKPTFTGTEKSVTVSGTATGSVSISVGTGTANYTPAGTVSKPTFTGTEGNVSVSGTATGSVSTPTITVTPNTATVNSITDVGTLPSWTGTVTGEKLTISWSTGTLPTKGSNQTVVTGIKSATSSQPSFTGSSFTSTGKFTPAGSVSQPTFTGTGKELKAAFTGSSFNSTGKFTPEGLVSQPTFDGTSKTVTVS